MLASQKPLSVTRRSEKHFFEYVSQRGTTQQWRSASQAFEVVWRGTVGKVITSGITSCFSIPLDGQKYPRRNLQINCQPTGALGSITNTPYVAPPDYVVVYEANLVGTYTIKNGSFGLTVKIIAVSS